MNPFELLHVAFTITNQLRNYKHCWYLKLDQVIKKDRTMLITDIKAYSLYLQYNDVKVVLYG